MTWDYEYTDEAQQVQWRVRCKPLTVHEGIAADVHAAEIAKREDTPQMIITMYKWPLMQQATLELQRKGPDDEDFQTLELTEETYLSVPENFSYAWHLECIKHNPHRDMSYEQIKKLLPPSEPKDKKPTSKKKANTAQST